MLSLLHMPVWTCKCKFYRQQHINHLLAPRLPHDVFFKLQIHQIYMVDPYLIVLKRNPIQAYDRKGQDGGRFLWLLTHFDITIRRRGKHILSFSMLVAHSGSLT